MKFRTGILARLTLTLTVTGFVVVGALAGCSDSDDSSRVPADTVYHGGAVLTVDASDTVAEALVVKDGKIIAVGGFSEMSTYIGTDTKLVDLAGKTLIPGIYDAHSDMSATGTIGLFEANLNSPPISTVRNIDDVVTLLQQQFAKVGPGNWVTGFGYDDTLLAEQRHPTRADLDRVSATQPVFINHISGHLAVVNSAALPLAGITVDTPNPPGGVIRRDANGQPDGVLEETATALVSQFRPALTAAQLQEGVRYASQLYASQGVTTANEGAADADGVNAMEEVARAGGLPIRVVAWPMLETIAAIDKVARTSGKVKIGGVKDFADGSIRATPATSPIHITRHFTATPATADFRATIARFLRNASPRFTDWVASR